VIDTRGDCIIETIWTRQNPGDLFGASPNALAFNKSGRHLYVCNGTQNAVGVIEFNPGKSKLTGLIPVGWFPGAVAVDSRRNELYEPNIKALAVTGGTDPGETNKFNTHQYCGIISLVPIPDKKVLLRQTEGALTNMRYPLLAAAQLPSRPDQPPRPVPE